MKQKTLFLRVFSLFLCLIVFNIISIGQTTCPNSDFSNGDFSNWVGQTGHRYSDGSWLIQATGIVFGRHTIINTPGIDPHTCGNLSVLPPGKNICARLGNDSIHGGVERLRYTITVDSSNNLFIYQYAVVLQDPGHAIKNQPLFQITMKDNKDNLLQPEICSQYLVAASAGIPGFQTCKSDSVPIIYKDWTSVGIDLMPYFGKQVTIEFTTADCGLGQHFGYAYLSASCMNSKIKVLLCDNNNPVTLVAPEGFTYLWDTGDTTQKIIISNPQPGEKHSCQLTSFQGQLCSFTLEAVINKVPQIKADFGYTNNCSGQLIQFSDSSSFSDGTINKWNWDFDDGTTDTIKNPEHIFQKNGSYNVTLTVYSDMNCFASVTKKIMIADSPKAYFSFDSVCTNTDKLISFYDMSTSQNKITNWNWHFGDGFVSSSQNPQHAFQKSNEYDISLKVTDSIGCSDSISRTLLITKPPMADFSFNSQCAGTPINFIDKSTYDALDSIAIWKWIFPDNIYYIANPSQVFMNGGKYDVKLYIETKAGCEDSAKKQVDVYFNPVANFNHSPEIITTLQPVVTFTDKSTNTDSWTWDFGDGSSIIYEQNPVHTYSDTGYFKVKLISANIYGCKDIREDLLFVAGVSSLFIPNAFTPGSNNINDYFGAVCLSCINFEMFIFDRWGAQIFYTNDIKKMWDGRYQGKVCKQDVYVYLIKYTDLYNRRFHKYGKITLLK